LARSKRAAGDSIMVIGLGRFGASVAATLIELGHEVMGVDSNASIVQDLADKMTHVVQADTTDIDILASLGAASFKHAVVAIGADLEASVLTVLGLAELGVPNIWAKAMNTRHGHILTRTGAHHVVYPEAEMGARVAHLVTGRLLEFVEFEDGYAIVKIPTPAEVVGKSVEEAALRARHGVTIIGIKSGTGPFVFAGLQTRLKAEDLLFIAGETETIERFATSMRA
jgi:trk system potassium uptake protein